MMHPARQAYVEESAEVRELPRPTYLASNLWQLPHPVTFAKAMFTAYFQGLFLFFPPALRIHRLTAHASDTLGHGGR